MKLQWTPLRALIVLSVCLCTMLGAAVKSEAGPRPALADALDTGAIDSSAEVIAIGGNGFTTADVSAYGPTDVAWENRSGITVTLRSGSPAPLGPTDPFDPELWPSDPGTVIYLPTIIQGSGSLTSADERPRVLRNVHLDTVDFVVTLGPGDIFVQRYSAPGTYVFHLVAPPQAGAKNLVGQLTLAGTGLLDSSPQNGEDGVAVTRETVLAFSAPLDPATVTDTVFTASAAGTPLNFRLHLSADQRQVTLFYTDPLPGDTLVTVAIDGATLRAADGGLVDVDGDSVAGGEGQVAFTTLSLATVPGTSVCGRVFASEVASDGSTSVNEPLQGATITVDGREQEMRTVTDIAGNFCLNPAPAGRFFVHIDGRTAGNASGGGYYPFVGKAWESTPGIESSVGDIYLPLVEPGTLQPVSQTEDVTIGFAPSVLAAHPEFAGVAITVPAGSLFHDDGAPGNNVGIAPVPPDRLPGQLPEGLDFPLVITVQTDGATNFDSPAPICFPNLPHPDTGTVLQPGERTALWSFNHDTGRFGVVGPMTANGDGSLICTDPGVGVLAPGWHSWNPGVPTRGGRSRPSRRPPPPPPPPDEDEDCTPGEETCEQKIGPVPPPNGCGPQALIDVTGDLTLYNNPVMAFAPSEIVLGGCDFRRACNTHDLGYGQCKSNKPQVDTTFLNDMQAACQSCYNPRNPLSAYDECMLAAEALYQAVSNGGERFYNTAQEEACECEQCAGGSLVAASVPSWYVYEWPVQASALQNDDLLTGLTYYMTVNLDTGLVQRGAAGSNGIAFERDIILSPLSRYRIFLLHADTLHEDYMDVVTPNSGEALELPAFYVYENLGYDLDGDGLAALGEEIMGTDPGNPDSDGDGVLDGAEVQAGQDPLSGVLVRTGIIGSAETPGSALDVCVSGDIAAVADGDQGVAIFNVFGGMNPKIVAQVDTPGSAAAVACDGESIAVADGSTGLAVIDISDPAAAAIVQQVSFGDASALSVVAANGSAYVGLTDGRIVQIELSSGAVGQTRTTASPQDEFNPGVEDVMLLGDFLYAMTESGIFSFFGSTLVSMAESSAYYDPEMHFRRRLAGGDDLVLATESTHVQLSSLEMPLALQYESDLNPNIFGWRHAVPNGTGLALASSAPDPDSPPEQFRVSVYDMTDRTIPGFLVEYETPGLANALAIDQGLAYVADGDAGLQVINFQAADTLNMTPTVTLDSNFADGLFQAGSEMRLTARAEDDVQVRDVAFYLDGELLQIDGSYPFEIRFTTPDVPAITLRARATDTGGNVAWSEEQTRSTVPDAAKPEVLSVAPARDTYTPQEILVVQATFSEAMNPASLNAATFLLLNEADEAAAGAVVSYDVATQTASLTFDPLVPAGLYEAVLTNSVTDAAGNALPRRAWSFEVTETLSDAIIRFSEDPGSALTALDIDGDWLVVGASGAAVGGNSGQGSAYLFTRDGSTASGWREVKKLTASDGAANDYFAQSLAIAGDTVVIGAPRKAMTSTNQGQVYVFSRDHGGADNWGEVARFADTEGRSTYFGSAVDIVGDTFVVAPAGIVKTGYLYRRSGVGATDWHLAKEVTLDTSPRGQNFGAGEAIALSDDEQTLFASIPRAHIDANQLNEGVVNVFEQDEGGADNWGLAGTLQASDASEDAYFGGNIAFYNDVLVVGSPFYDTSQELNATGQLYFFVRDGADPQGWREVAVFDEPQTKSSVRALGSVVGAGMERAAAVGETDIYVYQSAAGDPTQWSRSLLWRSLGEPDASWFNGIIAVDGDTIATTATLEGSGEPAIFLLEGNP